MPTKFQVNLFINFKTRIDTSFIGLLLLYLHKQVKCCENQIIGWGYTENDNNIGIAVCFLIVWQMFLLIF